MAVVSGMPSDRKGFERNAGFNTFAKNIRAAANRSGLPLRDSSLSRETPANGQYIPKSVHELAELATQAIVENNDRYRGLSASARALQVAEDAANAFTNQEAK
ncbi:hypothetical protein A3F37_02295 [Candidatus Saccharibacteria bacterium RIFCSPHIGHO2_12_FULL_41_12]|nr:MAG: hypothetical protein A3F37_02295 [Candidatus Saccharibacteria bacterium RIFCSPHIGHO2_12_FULL_41_12]